MSASAQTARGRPVFVLAVILTAWIGGRIAMWEPADQMPPLAFAPEVAASAENSLPELPAPEVEAAAPVAVLPLPDRPSVMKPAPWIERESLADNPPDPPVSSYGGDFARDTMRPSRSIAGHAMLLRSGRGGISRLLEARYSDDERPAARPNPAFVPRAAQLAREELADERRFSADAWGLWRDGGASAVAPGAPSYGRSQMGAVLRYALAAGSPHRPEAHLRASVALDGARERDMALGVSARPAGDFPARVAVEGRVTDTEARTELRAGAYVVSEIAPVDLPAGARGEVYLQGGYVTGRDGTPFVDGHIRVTRDLTGLDDFRLSAGGGAWGGAQEGTERLDVGPTASVTFPVGEGHARISADYRVRVAGDAMPDSGPALTLATGF